jgi:hypothetical protein
VTLPASVTTQRQIFLFWAPLAASWLLMGAEVPVLQVAIARLTDMQTQLAAFGICMSIEIAIESPVIMLLATSTALSTNARNYLTLRRFMIWINVLATAIAFLVAFTRLYDLLVRSVMGMPDRIADAAQPGMRIMTLWTAAIGMRRFYQGVMIRHGRTRAIGRGNRGDRPDHGADRRNPLPAQSGPCGPGRLRAIPFAVPAPRPQPEKDNKANFLNKIRLR